ncbi:Putative amino acid ligase of ATP-grasp superfamily [Bacillus mycoides]|uniref:ATP-grasp domain-containing protein n=1 Tax=Bacillus mycoides TaxID=1405 RepID=UPI000818208C|nr:ATP-grasp domain-containing protein [Bacillus mycoides]SCB02621.1 Putative amino acid ligase of ATP-grasp superfamily [Bacillus mycoides]
MRDLKEKVLLINRFPFWVYTDSTYPFNDVDELCILHSHEAKFDFPPGKFSSVIICDLSDMDIVDSAVEHLYKNHHFTKVINTTERYMELASKIREKYSIPGMDLETSTKFRNKMVMKKYVEEAGILVPKASTITNKEDIVKFYNTFGKSIIKPIDGMGTKNTFVINQLDDISVIIEKIDKIDHYEIEQFITGDMYHCDSVIIDGEIKLCSVSRYLNSTMDFSKDGYLASVMIDDPILKNKIKEYNLNVIKALDYRNGVTHLEVFLSNDELVFCEIAARPGGAGVIPSVKHVFGVDLTEALINIQLGNEVQFPKAHDTYAGWLVIHKKEGIVSEISKEEDFDFNWVLYKHINTKRGDIIKNAENSVSSVADFTISGESENDLIKKIEMIRNDFKFTTK